MVLTLKFPEEIFKILSPRPQPRPIMSEPLWVKGRHKHDLSAPGDFHAQEELRTPRDVR